MGNEQASDKRRSPAYALVRVDEQGSDGEFFWLAMQITPQLADAIERGQAARSLGLRGVVLELQCDAWVLRDEVASTLEAMGYEAAFDFGADESEWLRPDGKLTWVITDDDINAIKASDEDKGLRRAMSDWGPRSGSGRWNFLSVELLAGDMRLRVCQSPDEMSESRMLISWWASIEHHVPQMLGTFARYHGAPPEPSVAEMPELVPEVDELPGPGM